MASRETLEFYEWCEEVRTQRELEEEIKQLPLELQKVLKELASIKGV